jgi:hypothetical protein
MLVAGGAGCLRRHRPAPPAVGAGGHVDETVHAHEHVAPFTDLLASVRHQVKRPCPDSARGDWSAPALWLQQRVNRRRPAAGINVPRDPARAVGPGVTGCLCRRRVDRQGAPFAELADLSSLDNVLSSVAVPKTIYRQPGAW